MTTQGVEEMAGPGRRLIICCDGTWTDSDDNPTIPSNVTRLCRALNNNHVDTQVSTRSVHGSKMQTVFYHRGLGTGGTIESKWLGGGTGFEITQHVKECYGFLCNNYRVGDEIFLFGFSRGAYTVRVASTLVSDVGLLTAKGMEFFYEIFEDWKNQNVPEKSKEVQGTIKEGAFKGLPVRPKMPSAEYKGILMERGYSRPDVPIKCLGVWDTVGALGIPPVLGLHLSETEKRQFSFVNTKVSQKVVHALQALALDEHRAVFSPCLWEQPDAPNNLQSLKQVWFAGVHCNVGGGGGYEDQGLANITLAWMIHQLQTLEGGLLHFDEGYLRWIFQRNIDHCNEYYVGTESDEAGHVVNDKSGFRGWGLGRIEETMTTLFSLIGNNDVAQENKPENKWLPGILPRSPGEYDEIDVIEGGGSVKTGRRLKGTGERVHCSVRVRMATPDAKSIMVKGVEQVGYVPWAMKGWETLGGVKGNSSAAMDPLAGGYSWKNPHGEILEEEGLGSFETVLLDIGRQAAPKP